MASGMTGATAARALLQERERYAYAVYGGLLALVLLGRPLRRVVQARRGTYRISHSNGRLITAPVGHSLLEALRDAGIPHASVCGGRARCTTCRVRVGPGAKGLPPPETARGERTASHPCRRRCAPGVPAAAHEEPAHHAAFAAERRTGRNRCAQDAGTRASRGRDVRRSARVEPAWRAENAVRRILHSQPFLCRDGRSAARNRRLLLDVQRRRTDGALRDRDRSRSRVPRCDARRGRHRSAARPDERRARRTTWASRCAPASASTPATRSSARWGRPRRRSCRRWATR